MYKGKKVLAFVIEVVSISDANEANAITNPKETMGLMAKDLVVGSGRTIKTKSNNLKLRAKIHERGFEAKLNMIAHQKGLIYL